MRPFLKDSPFKRTNSKDLYTCCPFQIQNNKKVVNMFENLDTKFIEALFFSQVKKLSLNSFYFTGKKVLGTTFNPPKLRLITEFVK